jgi:hypothetical protein
LFVASRIAHASSLAETNSNGAVWNIFTAEYADLSEGQKLWWIFEVLHKVPAYEVRNYTLK